MACPGSALLPRATASLARDAIPSGAHPPGTWDGWFLHPGNPATFTQDDRTLSVAL